ncbi:MAG: transporter substrate-binding domain-containing protein [Candidatus Competibacterales bacterium]
MPVLLSRRRALTLLSLAGASLALPPLARAAVTLDDIKQSGVLRIGCEATYPPFTFREAGEIVGYDVDLAAIMAQTLGVEPQFIDTQWSGIIPALYAGRFEIIMSSMSYKKERLERVAFSIPYAEASQALLIRAEDQNTITSLDGMSDRVMGVKLGSPGETIQVDIHKDLESRLGQGFKDVKIYDDHPAAYLALAQGSVDGVLNTLPTLGQVLKDRPGRYAIVRGVGQQNWAGIAARQEDTEIVQFLDAELKRLKDNGEIYALQEKWFGFEMDLADDIPSFA